MDGIKEIQIALEVWGAIISVSCAAAVSLGKEFEYRKSQLLVYLLLTSTALLGCDSLAMIYRGIDTIIGNIIVRISNYVVFSCFPLMAWMMALYFETMLIQAGGASCISKKLIQITKWTSIVDLGVIFLSQFTGILYYYDDNNFYHRAPNFWISSMFGMVLLVFLTSIVLLNFKKISRYERWAILTYIFLPFTSNIIQMFYYGLSLNTLATSVAMILVFYTHEIEKSRYIVRQELVLSERELGIALQQQLISQKDAELAGKRIQISISQMQPHFIFNALGSIEQLCKRDAAKAATAIHQFAKYLRANINALNSTELVTLTDELEHVRTYVWLEKMRFGDDIEYREELNTEKIKIPALSLQPLVENAIKYGMITKEEGILHVVLRTEELEDSYCINVEDDGDGFDPNAQMDTSRIHVGLSNVKERVRLMTGGQLRIDSEKGRGTTVTIQIPKKKS